jgi:hypothetical protein
VDRGHGGGAGGGSVEPAAEELVLEDAQQRRRSVAVAVAEGEGPASEEAAPGLADQGGAEEAPGVFRREAEQDVVNEFGQQLGQRRRRHGCCAWVEDGEGFGGEKRKDETASD